MKSVPNHIKSILSISVAGVIILITSFCNTDERRKQQNGAGDLYVQSSQNKIIEEAKVELTSVCSTINNFQMTANPDVNHTVSYVNDRYVLELKMRQISIAYLLLKNSMIDENSVDIQNYTSQFINIINDSLIDFKDPANIVMWEYLNSSYHSSLEEILASDNLEDKRVFFNLISIRLYCVLKFYDPIYHTAFYINYCQEALDNNGAYWVSEFVENRNPYFGPRLLGCGELIEKIPFATK